jgi:hypothetical protein
MLYKQICPIHHYRYSGAKCPICERERINNMVHRFVKKEENKTVEAETTPEKDLDWSALADKFNIKGI